MIKEVCLPIKGYCDRYLISNHGRVFSVYSGKFLCLENKGGYLWLRFKFESKRVSLSVHRLVGLYFIPNPDNKSQINHIDGIKCNNIVDNLEWCTPKENIVHAVNLGLFMSLKRKAYTDSKKGFQPSQLTGMIFSGDKNGKSRVCYMFNINKEFIRSYESQNMCGKDLGIKQSNIHRAISKGYSCHGYYFSYARNYI